MKPEDLKLEVEELEEKIAPYPAHPLNTGEYLC